MCGIIGYIGARNAVDVLIDGLTHLAYRGYDSCGIAVFNDGKILTRKATGKIQNLIPLVKEYKSVHTGIGHTRWATHGEPTIANAHPHGNAKLSLVHNGIIENYQEIKDDLQSKGIVFTSETDTEVIAHLLNHLLINNDIKTALQKLHESLKGAYALAIVLADDDKTLYAMRKDSPLIIGIGNSEHFISSDIAAILDYTKDYYILNDGEMAIITKDHASFFNLETLTNFSKETETASWNISTANKGAFDTFMLKEINEQPLVFANTLRHEIEIDDSFLENIEDIHIVACGTAMHSGLVAKHWIEKHARKRVHVEVASEFRYKNPILHDNDLVMVISQSGETADSLACLRLANDRNIRTLAIVNVFGSTIQREAQRYIMTHAGTEIAVASTKAYLAQLATLYQFTQRITNDALPDASGITEILESQVNDLDTITAIAKEYGAVTDAFYIGRGLDYAVALEGSLKLKEISYVHAESYPAGELKHGTISLVTDSVLTLAIATQSHTIEKTLSNIQEVRARKSKMILLAPDSVAVDPSQYDHRIVLPLLDDDLMPFVATIPLQQFAYSSSLLRGCDVDQPRNLAKSVTVE